MREEQLLACLKSTCFGKRRAIRSTELERMLGISGNELRKLVNRLRRAGVPIASCAEGYYYAANAGEIYATIRQLRRMAAGLEAAISGLEDALARFGEGGDSP